MYYPKTFLAMPFFFLLAFVCPYLSTAATLESISWGSFLSVERSHDVIVSPDHTFSAGFYGVGDNAFCFAVWFNKSVKFTPVWMANRDQPVNGRRSALSLQKGGNLVLTDAGRLVIWKTDTASSSPVQLRLQNTGNLMILQISTNKTLWQSFGFPTDTLLPLQPFTREMKLIASRSQSNYSSRFYSFFFDNDNIMRLLYSTPNISSTFWPDPGLVTWDAGRTTYNSSRIAAFDLSGYFQSSDDLKFSASDFGVGPMRRLTIGYDGNLRLYSLDEKGDWGISWQAIPEICSMHGLCGPNGICVYEQSQRRCSCPSGFKLKDPTDLSQGCWPTFNLSCDPLDSKFITLPYTEFYGYDLNYTENLSLQQCMNICLKSCSCKAILYRGDGPKGNGQCYPKTQLLNGFHSPAFNGTVHIRVPINETLSDRDRVWLETTVLSCDPNAHVELDRTYEQKQENSSLKYLLWFVAIIGGVELICIYMGWWYMNKNNSQSAIEKGYMIAPNGFKRFRYHELKKATRNFSEVIGRGGGGVVYKGVLPDERVVAVKRLEGVNQGEAEFLAEISVIGRINHMNLILVWGFCVERRRKFLVYEYMECGTLADNLSSDALDWEKRFEIAVGTAKGLAYLHEECLEWVLHCDVKPQNILLDANCHPKVADFGLSKLRDRSGNKHLNISKIRGTRGYMAPEWILNQPITSKVDVYSYGIVLLEMVTGRNSFGFNIDSEGDGKEFRNLVTWVREMTCATNGRPGRIGQIIDPKMDAAYDVVKMEILVKVALQCVEEDKDARPTMTQVVQMLVRHEYDY
ncbi:hypothetical protein AAC387_Pa11g0098 [Persea americana]